MEYSLVNIFNLIFLYNIYVKCFLSATDIKGFDDTVLFKINWPGKDGSDLLDVSESESMMVTSSNKEKYRCIIPTPQDKSKDSEDSYDGPNALEILQPLFLQPTCTYRLESYWTYEVCHGRYVRQYHEDREVAKTKTQEYYLGRWDKDAHDKLDKELDNGLHYPPPLKKMDGLNLPYLQLNMTDGTLCDLNGLPRQVNVLYVCYTAGKNEIYSFKETSTCQYELIVLSSLLCQHPNYKPQDTGEHSISCLPVEGAPKKPRNLRKMLAENVRELKLQQQKLLDDDRLRKVFAVISVNKVMSAISSNDQNNSDGENRVRVELRPLQDSSNKGDEGTSPLRSSSSSTTPTGPIVPPPITDTSPVESFLSGKNCLQGGSGWWKYEFCYGRKVDHYHVEPDNSRTVINLGVFDRAAHIAWLAANPHKRPKPLPDRKQVSHYYGNGALCDKTGMRRETEVKLKCVESSSPGAVSMYLIEPHTCQYILGVESPLVCQLLPTLDQYGLTEDLDDLTSLDDDDDEEETVIIVHDEH